MHKTIGIIALLIYLVFLSDLAVGEYFFQRAIIEQDVAKAKLAVLCNPWSSVYRYAVFQYSHPPDIASLKEAIRLEPLKAAYHMYFALELFKDYQKRTRQTDAIAFHEIQTAYTLKPYSDNYKQIYEHDAKPYL